MPHEVPDWVPDGARYFITINCRQRGINALCLPEVAPGIIEGLNVYERLGHWYPWRLVLMPDHLHLITSFPRAAAIRRTVSAWKGYFARTLKIDWQADFFEHRVRNDCEFDEKSAYIRENPVRKGLVPHADLWPYSWVR